MKPEYDVERTNDYLSRLKSLYQAMEICNDNVNIQNLFADYKQQSLGYDHIVETENNTDLKNAYYDKMFLEELIESILKNFVHDDSLLKNKKDNIQMLLQYCLTALKGSDVVKSLSRENKTAKSLLEQIRLMLQSNVSREEKDAMKRKIIAFEKEYRTEEEYFEDFKHFVYDIFHANDNDHDLMKKLENGWDKNSRELEKRSEKMNLFQYTSNSRLESIEKEIEKHHVENKQFRKLLNKTSDQITDIIQRLKTANNESDFLNKQVNIIDSTIQEMEKCKQKTEFESLELAHLLEEKHTKLQDYLKCLDEKLEEKVYLHSQYTSTDQKYSNAIDELSECYANFEEQENFILTKYEIEKPKTNLQKEKDEYYLTNTQSLVNDTKNLTDNDQTQELPHIELSGKIIDSIKSIESKDIEEKWKLVDKLQKDKTNLLKEKENLEHKIDNLTVDVEDLYNVNSKLNTEVNILKSQINGSDYIPGTCVIPTKKQGVTVRFPIIEEVDENFTSSIDSLNEQTLSFKDLQLGTDQGKYIVLSKCSKCEQIAEVKDLEKQHDQLKGEIKNFGGEISYLRRTISNLSKRKDELENEIKHLTSNIEVYDNMAKISTKNVVNHAKETTKMTNSTFEDTEGLQFQIDDLQLRNEQLLKINKKAQDIFEENKDLLEENGNLQEEIENLEDIIKDMEYQLEKPSLSQNKEVESQKNPNKIDSNKKEQDDEIILNLRNEITILERENENLKISQKPRILHVQTRKLDVLQAKPNGSIDETLNIEQELNDQFNRNKKLEKTIKELENSYNTLQNICQKISLSTIPIGKVFEVTFSELNDNKILSSNNIVLKKEEMELIKQPLTGDIKFIPDDVVEELSSMLQQSYQDYDKIKQKQRELQNEVERLKLELNYKNGFRINNTDEPNHKFTNEEAQVMKVALENMGIARLEFGVMYSVHFQALTKSANSRRASRAYQNSCKPMKFDEVKNLIKNIPNKTATPQKAAAKSRNVPKYDETFENVDFSVDALVDTLENKQYFAKSTSNEKSAEEFEASLRKSNRQNAELKKANKILREKLQLTGESKSTFKNVADDIMENVKNETPENNADSQKAFDEDIEDAYKLSEANCVFLEKRCIDLERKKRTAELQIEQEKLNADEYKEEKECIAKELLDLNKKNKEYSKTVIDLKKDIDYLEKDLEYYKQIVIDNGIETEERSIQSPIKSALVTDSLMLLKADLENVKNEKHQLLMINESLNAKLKFTETEKKYITNQFEELLKEKNVSVEKISHETITEERTENKDQSKNRSDSTEIRQVGLVKKYKQLQGEYLEVAKKVEKLTMENSELTKQNHLQEIDLQTIKTTNSSLTEKIIDLEDKNPESAKAASLERKKKTNMASKVIQHWSNLLGKGNKNDKTLNSIKEDTILLAHENEEIKQSNNVLLQRNSELRKENLSATNAAQQIELLKDRLSTVENENTVLKIENLNLSSRKSNLGRKFSRQYELSTLHLSGKTNNINKSTQTKYDFNSENMDDLDLIAEIEELKFIIQDLTKRNSEGKTQIYDLEEILKTFENKREELEKLNEKLLSRNSELKKQLEETNKNTLDSSADTNNPSLGISFSFKDNILNDYEKIELQEENKSLKYESKTLKEEVENLKDLCENQNLQYHMLKKNNDQLEAIKEELILILKEVKDQDFVESLLKSLSIPDEKKDTGMDEFLVQHKQPITETSESGANLLADVSSFNTEKLNQIPTSEGVDGEKLHIENTYLKKQVENYKNMVEHLERQLLQSDTKKTYFSRDTTGENTDKIDDENYICTSSTTQNETIDELFQVKFLLESNNRNDVVLNLPNAINDDLNKLQEKDDDLSYEKCIEEGELASEMEDLFKSFNENSIDDLPDIPDEKIDEDKPSPIPIPIERETEITVPVSSVQRFKSKEQLEAAVNNLEIQNKIFAAENETLKQNMDECQQQVFKAKSEKEFLEKEIELLHKSITDSVFLLDEEKTINFSLNEQISELNEHLSKSNTNINDLNNLLSKKIDNEKKLEKEIEEKICEITKLQKNTNELELIINDQDVTIDNIDKKYHQLQNDYENILAVSDERETRIKELISEVNFLNDTVNIYQQKTTENDDLVNQLKIQLELQTKESYEVTELNNTIEDALLKNKDELESLKEEFNNIQQENKELKEKQKILEESASDLVDIIQEFEKKDKELQDLSNKLQVEKDLNFHLRQELDIEKNKRKENEDEMNKEIEQLKEKDAFNIENNQAKIVLQNELKKLKLDLAEKENLVQVLKERAASIIPFELKTQENQFQLAEAELKAQIGIQENEIDSLKEKLSEKDNVIAMYAAKFEDDDVITDKPGIYANMATSNKDMSSCSSIPMIKISEDLYEKNDEAQRAVSLPTQFNENSPGFGPHYRNILLSDVSDDESFFDVLEFNEQYITKLKEKIKHLREKLREKNKTIKNQNEDLDNFLEDIRGKDNIISQLKNEIKLFEEAINRSTEARQERECQTIDLRKNSTQDPLIDTQSSLSTLQCSSEMSKQIDYLVLPETSYEDLKELRGHVENLRKVSLHESAHVLEEKINHACKLVEKLEKDVFTHACKCITQDQSSNKSRDLTNNETSFDFSKEAINSLSSEEIPYILDQRIFSTPVILKSPGKTVQQIRHDNEKLLLHNNELKLVREDLENDISQFNKLNEKQASEISVLKEQLQQLEITVVKIKNEKELEIIKAVDAKEKELREFYFKNKEDMEKESFDEYLIEKDEIIACKDPSVLLDRIERMNEKIRTAERQIENDWIIIEGQGVQLENLHQQFIEQRDENYRNCQLLQITDKELYNKEEKVGELEKELDEKRQTISQQKEDIIKIKAASRFREEELGHLLLEKEEGIEKLHCMISELETSLNNSQRHIDGILNESMEKREKENEKSELIRKQETMIGDLKNEIEKIKLDFNRHVKIQNWDIFNNLKENIQTIKNNYHNTKDDINSLLNLFKNLFESTCEVQKRILSQNLQNGEENPAADSMTSVIETSQSHENISDLKKIIDGLKQELEQRDEIYQLQIDTLLKSLAKRSNVIPRTTGKVLLPTMELSKTSTRLGSSEFLKVCLDQLKDVESSHSNSNGVDESLHMPNK